VSSGSLTREAPESSAPPAGRTGATLPNHHLPDHHLPDHHPGRAPFRSDIEGLRGLAVLLVVAFHAGVPWLPGGFVGVDVFFVLSGFLITGLLVDQLRHTGTVSLTGFYARRVRRLLPHGTLVLIASGLAAHLLLPPLDHPQVAGDISAAALFWANWHFAAAATDYLTATDQSVVLHYWSLSVEEQFYLRLAADPAGRHQGRGCGALLVGRHAPTGLDARHARPRLLRDVGAAHRAVRPVRLLRRTHQGLGARGRWRHRAGPAGLGFAPRWSAAFAGWAGVTLVVWRPLRFDEGTVFPGSAAAVPVSGAALLIIAGARLPYAGASGLLSARPMTWLGRHSYGFYLWHWPCLVLLREHYGSTGETGEAQSVPAWAVTVTIAVSLALAVIGARIVETPIRRSRRLARGRARSLALGGALTACAVLTASLVLDPRLGHRRDRRDDRPGCPVRRPRALERAEPRTGAR
jgi:peptidoglycan/LPS O-acetylase OafA/YrhL